MDPSRIAGAAPSPAPNPDETRARTRDSRTAVNVPGGRARLVGEVAVRPDGRPDEELVVQALEAQDGEPLVRVGYRRGRRMVRGPLTANAAELAALVAALRTGALLPERFWAAAGLPVPASLRDADPGA